jgi:hypothetical protein
MVVGVEPQTHARGTDDTRSGRRLRLTLLLSVILHVLPFPAHLLQGMLGYLVHRDQVTNDDRPTIIPIELQDEESTPPEAQKPPDELTEITVTPSKPTAADSARDAGPKPGKDAAPDAPAADAAEPQDAAMIDAPLRVAPDAAIAWINARNRIASGAVVSARPALSGVQAAALLDGGVSGEAGSAGGRSSAIADPVALAGQAGAIARSPNVSLILYPERMRSHPLIAHFGPVLGKIPQWQAFFQGTGIDPIQDTDRIMVAGPQFRDSSRIVAVVRYRVPDAKVRQALSAIVDHSKGQWLDAGVPAAKAFAERADRIFVVPAPNILVVAPPDGLEQALRVRSIPAGDRTQAFVLYIRTPRNALHGLPIDIPQALDGLRFAVSLTPDGGADLHIDVKDRDAAAATADARQLTDDVEKLAVINIFFHQERLFGPVTFRAEADHIRADTHLTQDQLKLILSHIATQIDFAAQRAAPRPSGG